MIKREELHLIMGRERKGHRDFKRTIKKKNYKDRRKTRRSGTPQDKGEKNFYALWKSACEI